MLRAIFSFSSVAVIWFCYALLPTLRYKYLKTNRLGSKKPALLLTFDDGPDPKYTPQLLKLLAKYDVKAVFFLLGYKVCKYPEIARQIADEGHSIGFHGMEHYNHWRLTPQQIREDFAYGLEIFEHYGLKAEFYRPPHGNITLATDLNRKNHGLQLLLWSMIVGDWCNCGKRQILRRLVDNLHAGAVILLHDSADGTGGEKHAPKGTIAALDVFIPLAQRAGYCFIDIKKEPFRKENE